jgi:hypothetical protein
LVRKNSTAAADDTSETLDEHAMPASRKRRCACRGNPCTYWFQSILCIRIEHVQIAN